MKSIYAIVICAGWTELIAADYVPLKAEATSRVFQLGVDGTRKVLVEDRGIYLRDARGNDLRRMKGSRERGEMRNLQTRRSYTIEYSRAVVIDHGEVPAGVPMSFRDAKPLDRQRVIGEEFVSGIRCLKVRGTDPTRHNFSLISLDYDLLVHSEVETVSSRGERYLMINSLENIHLHVVPDPADFRLPPSFQILERKAPEAGCGTCPRPSPNR